MKNLAPLAFALIAAVAGSSSPATAAEPLAATERLGYAGMGPARIGLGFFELVEASGRRMTVGPDVNEGCTYAFPEGLDGVAFMLRDRKVARVDVEKGSYLTISGAKIGDSEETVKRLYRGKVKVSPHKYVEGGNYLEVTSTDGRSALIFETDGKVVTSYRVGRLPEVRWIEGCS